jgi:hypothetical protein
VHTQYVQVREIVDAIQLNEDEDRVTWRLCLLGVFSSSSAYAAMFLDKSQLLGTKQLWKVRVSAEYKFFFGLALQDRCWTSDRLEWHGLSHNGTCALWLQEVEGIDHLIHGCVFSQEI